MSSRGRKRGFWRLSDTKQYAVQVGDNKILDRDHAQIQPRAPDPSRRAMTFEFRKDTRTPTMTLRKMSITWSAS